VLGSEALLADVLRAWTAFVEEHKNCGDLDDGRDGGYIWLACCSCGARIAYPVSAPPRRPLRT
jgi:hypothetical protein